MLDTHGVLMLATLASAYGHMSTLVVRCTHIAINVTTVLFLSVASLRPFGRTRATWADARWLAV